MLATVIVIVLIAVVVFGLLIFWLMRRSQTEVPQATDARAARDAAGRGHRRERRGDPRHGRARRAATGRRAFEALLQDEIRDRGMRPPRADDEA